MDVALSALSRGRLRNDRQTTILAAKEYLSEICKVIRKEINSDIKEDVISNLKIVNSLKFTRIKLSKELIPEDFAKEVEEHNGKKPYRIMLISGDDDSMDVILDKPLISRGQAIFFYFLRELLQFLRRITKELRKQRQLSARRK